MTRDLAEMAQEIARLRDEIKELTGAHLDNFTAMLDDKEVPYQRHETYDTITIRIEPGVTNTGETDGVVQGYGGFFTEFNFTKKGELINLGVWE